MNRKSVALLLILIGIGIICYPTVRDGYYEYQQRKLTAVWLESLQQVETKPAPVSQTSGAGAAGTLPDLTREMEGLLVIEKINLQVPILTGVTERNLNLAAASIEGMGKPGETGNYGVAAHNSHTYGVLFNRLNELIAGDQIVVRVKDQSYTYRVKENKIVQPEDVEVLRSDGEKKEITLVTCDYSAKPYRRIIVKGELEERKTIALLSQNN